MFLFRIPADLHLDGHAGSFGRPAHTQRSGLLRQFRQVHGKSDQLD